MTIRKAFSRLFFYRIYTLMQVGWFYNLPFRWPGKPAKTSSRQVLLELRPSFWRDIELFSVKFQLSGKKMLAFEK